MRRRARKLFVCGVSCASGFAPSMEGDVPRIQKALIRALLDSITFEKGNLGTHVRASLLSKSDLRNCTSLGVLSMIIHDLPVVFVMLVMLGIGRPFEQVRP